VLSDKSDQCGDFQLTLRTPFEDYRGKVGIVLYTKPIECRGKCLYCFSQDGYPNSYIENEDTLSARVLQWDPASQIERWIQLYNLRKNTGLKCDITVLGGTFTEYPLGYLEEFVKGIYDYLNDTPSASLDEAIEKQERGADRCVIFSVESRPELITEESCRFLLRLGVTMVEIGVQSLDAAVLELNNRRYTPNTVTRATTLLRKYGFKIGYHMMVGLPGSTLHSDSEAIGNELWKEDYCPDYLKIYPCVVLKGSYGQEQLIEQVDRGWRPITDAQYVELLKDVKPKIPPFVKVSRIQRLIPSSLIACGPSIVIDRKMFMDVCRCISHRAIGWRETDTWRAFGDYDIKVYQQGRGYYLEAVVENDTILGYARLGLYPGDTEAIIREIRILGKMATLNEKRDGLVGIQHSGIGRTLMKKMENLALRAGCTSILVNSGVGARQYFEPMGYRKEHCHMRKELLLSVNRAAESQTTLES